MILQQSFPDGTSITVQGWWRPLWRFYTLRRWKLEDAGVFPTMEEPVERGEKQGAESHVENSGSRYYDDETPGKESPTIFGFRPNPEPAPESVGWAA